MFGNCDTVLFWFRRSSLYLCLETSDPSQPHIANCYDDGDAYCEDVECELDAFEYGECSEITVCKACAKSQFEDVWREVKSELEIDSASAHGELSE